jgi:hypothetical protein
MRFVNFPLTVLIGFIASLFIALFLMSIQGCALFTPQGAPFLQGSVDAAVAAAVQKGIPATKIKSFAQQILAADTGTQVALGAIESLINAKIAAMNLPAGDTAAAQILASTLEGFIQLGLSTTAASKITAQTQVDVADICNDLITATALYGA